MHNCILKSHLSVEHREHYSQNTVANFITKIFPKISLLSKFCFSFARTSFLLFLNSPKFCTQKLTSPTLCPPHTTAPYPPLSRILFLHFDRCTYPVTVDRRLLATSVSCPHLPSPLQKIPDAHHPAEHPRIPRKKNPAPSSNAISRKKIHHLFRRPNNQNTQPTSPICLRIKYVNSQSFPQVHFLSAVRIYYSKTTRR